MKVSKQKGRGQGTRKAAPRPRLAVVQLAEAQPDYETEVADVSPDELPIEDRIRAAFGQVSETDHVTVHLYRMTQNNKPEEYLFACGPDDLENIMDRVRDAFGSGTYRVRVYKNRRIATQFDFSVYVPPKAIAPVAPQPEASALAQVLQRQNEMLERMMERLSAPPSAQGDRLDDAVKLIGALKTLQPDKPAVGFDPASMFTMLRSGFELFREMSPGGSGGDDDSLIGLAREGLKNLPALLSVMQPQAAVPAAAQLETTMVDSPPPPPSSDRASPPPPLPTGNALLDVLRNPLAYLVTRAARGASIEAAADWTLSILALEGVPDQAIAELLERRDLLQVLAVINPNVTPYQGWFADLLGAMRAALFEDEPETEIENANGANVGSAADSSRPAA